MSIILMILIIIAILLTIAILELNVRAYKRQRNVLIFIDNVLKCLIGYGYYCMNNGIEEIPEGLPSNAKLNDLIEEITNSSLPITLETWFTEEQIKIINIGNDTLTELKNKGIIQEFDDIVPLIEKFKDKQT